MLPFNYGASQTENLWLKENTDLGSPCVSDNGPSSRRGTRDRGPGLDVVARVEGVRGMRVEGGVPLCRS